MYMERLRGDGGAPVFGRHVVGFQGYTSAAPRRAVLERINIAVHFTLWKV